MTGGSSVIPLRQPDEIDDPLTAVLRSGARRLLAHVIEAEAEAFLATHRAHGAMRTCNCRMGVSAWSGTGSVWPAFGRTTARSAWSRPGSVRSRCSA